MRKIQLSEMAPHVHSFLPGERKTDKLVKWLVSWITISLKNGNIEPYDMLPSKAELAFHIGVSQGTIQNVFRFLEDAGYIESKQKIGSFIKDKHNKSVVKLTSKKDLATDVIKNYLKSNNCKPGDVLISTRKLAEIGGVSNATIRAAVANLVLQGILEKRGRSYILTGRSFKAHNIEAQTLVDKVADGIKTFIKNNLTPGDKIPPSLKLAGMFNVSVKTINDSVKKLAKEGLVYSKRGRYGTIVLGSSVSEGADLYTYEIVEHKIREFIAANFNIGDKLPAIKNLAIMYKTSGKTVKKALDNLADDGYITFTRGRYGGTFVTDVPKSANEAYTWIAINTNYVNK